MNISWGTQSFSHKYTPTPTPTPTRAIINNYVPTSQPTMNNYYAPAVNNYYYTPVTQPTISNYYTPVAQPITQPVSKSAPLVPLVPSAPTRPACSPCLARGKNCVCYGIAHDKGECSCYFPIDGSCNRISLEHHERKCKCFSNSVKTRPVCVPCSARGKNCVCYGIAHDKGECECYFPQETHVNSLTRDFNSFL